jgi:TRAP-type C4-dicarboxylate transport system permease small subunit
MSPPSPLERLLQPVLIVVSAVMVAAVTFQVIARYVFDAPPVWTTELSTLTLVYVTFFGSALVTQRGQGFRITVLRDRYVETSIGRRLWQAIRWFEVAFVLFIVVLSVPLVTRLWLQNLVALGISVGWMILAIPLGLAATAVALARVARDPDIAPPPAPEREMG